MAKTFSMVQALKGANNELYKLPILKQSVYDWIVAKIEANNYSDLTDGMVFSGNNWSDVFEDTDNDFNVVKLTNNSIAQYGDSGPVTVQLQSGKIVCSNTVLQLNAHPDKNGINKTDLSIINGGPWPGVTPSKCSISSTSVYGLLGFLPGNNKTSHNLEQLTRRFTTSTEGGIMYTDSDGKTRILNLGTAYFTGTNSTNREFTSIEDYGVNCAALIIMQDSDYPNTVYQFFVSAYKAYATGDDGVGIWNTGQIWFKMIPTNTNIDFLQNISEYIPPQYNYQPVASVSSGNKSYDFTMIKSEFINNGAAVDNAPASNFVRFSSMTKLSEMYENMADNESRLVCESGNNALFLEKYKNQVDQWVIQLHFYRDNATDFIIRAFSTANPGQWDYWLSYYVDNNAQKARPTLVMRFYQDETYSYNKEQPAFTDSELEWFYAWLSSYNPGGGGGGDEDNPYNNNGTNTGGGGNDYQPRGNDSLTFDASTPMTDATTNRFISIYNPTYAQLDAFGAFLWSSDFVDRLYKLYEDPIQSIMGLKMIPVEPSSNSTTDLTIGNLNSGVHNVKRVTSQFVVKDCGSYKIVPVWDSYLDYAPYTKVEVYLPFCGVHSLDTDEVMGKTINLKYKFDVLTGSCVAYISVDGNVTYQFMGQCGVEIPITGTNYSAQISSAINSAVAIGTTIATNGASALATGAGASRLAGVALGATAGAVASSKPTIEKAGSLAGTASVLSYHTPYITITQPKQVYPDKQNEFTGMPSFRTFQISDLFGKGFTKVVDCHLTINCTDEEKDEILSLLKEGVLL